MRRTDARADHADCEAPRHAAPPLGRVPPMRIACASAFKRQLRRQEAMRLRHRRFGAVEHVVAQLLPIGDFRLRAIHVPDTLAVDDEQMIAARPAGDVDILPELDRAFAAEDGQPAVAPCRQAVLREPVDADVAGGALRAQQHVAEILELRPVRMVEIGDVARRHFGLFAAGEEQELLDLVRADVAEDAAGALAAPEPVRAGRSCRRGAAPARRSAARAPIAPAFTSSPAAMVARCV